MTLQSSLRSALTLDVGVSALISERVYASVLPENMVHLDETFPAIVVQQVSRVPSHSHDGPTDYVEHRFQLNIWGKTFDDVAAVAVQVRVLLDGYRGPLPATGSGQTQIESCFLDDEDFDQDDPGDGRSLHLCRQDYLIASLE